MPLCGIAEAAKAYAAARHSRASIGVGEWRKRIEASQGREEDDGKDESEYQESGAGRRRKDAHEAEGTRRESEDA